MPKRILKPKFKRVTIGKISKLMGEILTGSGITKMCQVMNISDTSKESTKYKRMEFIFEKYYMRQGDHRLIVKMIEYVCDPIRYERDLNNFKCTLNRFNSIIGYEGYSVALNGKIIEIEKIHTITELKQKVNAFKEKLEERNIHAYVINFCTEELINENYFHCILEAAKSLLERIRSMSGLNYDGNILIDHCFKKENSIIQLNDLSTPTLQNRQIGFAYMLKGITSYVRNFTAHEPKVKWIIGEQEAVETLAIISFLHKILDDCNSRSCNNEKI